MVADVLFDFNCDGMDSLLHKLFEMEALFSFGEGLIINTIFVLP